MARHFDILFVPHLCYYPAMTREIIKGEAGYAQRTSPTTIETTGLKAARVLNAFAAMQVAETGFDSGLRADGNFESVLIISAPTTVLDRTESLLRDDTAPVPQHKSPTPIPSTV